MYAVASSQLTTAGDGLQQPVAPRQTLTVTATYWLSEAGRKAALLQGRDGRARQALCVEVPIARLHLVAVDAQGVPRLKLRPRYERDAEDQILLVDSAPTYDAPPSLEDLFAFAAQNYELERLYHARRTGARTQRLDAERELRTGIAQAFLSDPAQRALPHPAPTSTRCFMQTERGRRLFDVNTDEGLARELPPEAHRRFRADLRARRERNRQERLDQLARHEEKKHAIATWIAVHGTPDQQARQAAGVLPLGEAIEAMADHVFTAAGARSPYMRDGAARLQAHLRQLPAWEEAIVTPADLLVTSTEAPTATQAQWALLQELRAALPDATVILRAHRLGWKRDPRAPTVMVYSAAAIQKIGLFTLRREYAVPD